MKNPIVLFDGVCNLCNGAVQFLLKHDKKEKLRFASLQSPKGQELLQSFHLPTADFNSFVLIKNEKYYVKSNAALQICKELGGLYSLLTILWIIPSPIRNVLYDGIARNRYKWFGKKDQCMLPTPELKKRFLE
ncbi:thiol-disulfide oxidoreductase DCC family protein [Bacillus salitolerans]|uniref:Thiol-disulfide oxidoreductase DCC family protein n=1 Tax=Bacillus salitolerans TaxID=1437434 RepID=A0ABW4LIL3_9BACI